MQRTRAAMLLYFLVTAAGLAALVWSGNAGAIFGVDRVYAVPAIGLMTLWGAACSWLGRWSEAEWWSNSLPKFGLVGTTAGLILAFSGLTDMSQATLLHVLVGAVHALVANLVGIAGHVWLDRLRHDYGPR
jgi:hypothetical protein